MRRDRPPDPAAPAVASADARADADFQVALRTRLAVAYEPATVDRLARAITALVEGRRQAGEQSGQDWGRWVDQGDVLLISYADSLLAPGTAPLSALEAFLAERVADAVSGLHLLPFYPASSDDGFSVIDYRTVDPAVGDWGDVAHLAERYDLMFDAVINHVSRHSAWFKGFAAGDPAHREFFHRCDPAADYSQVTRPRALPLLTPVETAAGIVHVWTTFSDDQIDLNYAAPEVLLEILELLLFYADQGARFIRLDAIGFLWKRLGTSCMHLPETHAVIQVMRLVMDAATPGTILITETNVPHRDNISYFGDGGNEAHLVYQFPLPPLTLYAFQTGDARPLSDWAAALEAPSPGTTFFNFLASHDGIGVRPAEGLLSGAQIAAMAERVQANGGLVSLRSLPDGGAAPYEFNVTFVDAVSSPADDDALRAAKFLAAQTVLLSVIGVPAIYIHSLLGSRNDLDGVARSGRNRSINRARLDRAAVEAELADPKGLRRRILDGHLALLALRRSRPAFHPEAAQVVVPFDPGVFSLLRIGDGDRIWVAVNVSAAPVSLRVSRAELGFVSGAKLIDLIADEPLAGEGDAVLLELAPYRSVWVAAQ